MRGLTRLVCVCALAGGAAYLGWRVVATGDGADPVSWVVLLVAELLGFAVFAVRAWQAWPPAESESTPEGTAPGVTVIIDATAAPAADLRTTLIAVSAMRPRPEVLVVDERGNRWLRTVAERVGTIVLDRTINLPNAVATAPTDWVLLLETGEEPSDDLLQQAAGPCQQDGVSVVQLGAHDLDTTPLDDGSGPQLVVDLFDQKVTRPNLGHRGALPWYGDTPAIVRRSVLVEALQEPGAGRPVDVVDRRWRAGIGLWASGSRVTAVSGPSVGRSRPSTMEERLDLRREIAVRRRRSLGELAPTVRLGPRLWAAYLLAVLVPGVSAIGRLLQLSSLVLVLGFARQPLAGSWWTLLATAGAAYLSRWTANLLLGRGQLRPLTLLRAELHTLGADLGTLLPDGAAAGVRGHRVLVALEIALVASVTGRVVAVWAGVGGIPTALLTAALLLGVLGIGVIAGVLIESLTYVQRRAHRRVQLGMVTCRLEEHEGFLVDLSSVGVGVSLPGVDQAVPGPGSVTTLSFRVPAPEGRWRSVSSVVRVIRCVPDPEGGVRVGVEFDDPAAAPLDAVAEFLTSGSSWPVARREGPDQRNPADPWSTVGTEL